MNAPAHPRPGRPRKEPIPAVSRRAAVAGAVGTFIEYFDYMLFSTLSVYLAPSFFPTGDPATSVLVALSVFGVGYFAKPVGGIVFGRLGDRRGRRTSLLTTVLLMGACTSLMAILPNYATIGVAAPIMLIVLRLCQGASSGAELQGATTFVVESAPRSRRALLASLVLVGSSTGTAAGALLAAAIGTFVSPQVMLAWGWRIPFLVAVPLTVVAFLVRHRLEDSPEFQDLVRRGEVARTPVREALVGHRAAMLVAILYACGVSIVGGLLAWVVPYLTGLRRLDPAPVFLGFAIGTGLMVFVPPLVGQLTDRWGHRRVGAMAAVAWLVLSVPLLGLLGSVTSPVVLTAVLMGWIALVYAVSAPMYGYLAELFPTSVRFTASNFAVNVGATAFSGTSGLIATAIVLGVGSVYGVMIWIVAGIVLILVALGLAPRLLGSALPTTPSEDRSPSLVGDPQPVPAPVD